MGEIRKATAGEMLPGTLDMLILKTLSRGDMHGYAIVQFIQGASRDVLKVEEGALYRRSIASSARPAASGVGDVREQRRAKYYRLTAVGRRELDYESAYWIAWPPRSRG